MTPLNAQLIEACLQTRRLGRPTLYVPTVGSTNDVAHHQGRSGARDGTLVVTDEQTAGRGRLDRTWWAPAGTCLLMSLLLRPPLPLHRAGQLTMCLGLGAVEAIEQVAGIRPALKWPNDLLLNGRKLGGMLSELRDSQGWISYAVLGLGLNVNIPADGPGGLPPDLQDIATSLLAATGQPVDRVALLCALLERTESWYDRLLAGEAIHTAWAERLDTLGRPVLIRGSAAGPAGDLSGEATGVTPEGALMVRDRHGVLHMVWSGDAVTLRAG